MMEQAIYGYDSGSLSDRAYNLGYRWAEATGGEREYPLSGEWAGESIPELVLVPLGLADSEDWDLLDAVCEAFELGYEDWVTE